MARSSTSKRRANDPDLDSPRPGARAGAVLDALARGPGASRGPRSSRGLIYDGRDLDYRVWRQRKTQCFGENENDYRDPECLDYYKGAVIALLAKIGQVLITGEYFTNAKRCSLITFQKLD